MITEYHFDECSSVHFQGLRPMERQTRQREAVQHVLGQARRPLSAGELLNATRRAVTGIGIATIYRHLRTMVEEGEVVAVKLPGERVRYEPAGKTHHHHFVCGICGRVFEIPGCASDLRRMTPTGFSVDRHEVILYGRCSECSGRIHVAPTEPPSDQSPGMEHDAAGGSVDRRSTK
jgi:Fur family ferric uptake transcriptional regulator